MKGKKMFLITALVTVLSLSAVACTGSEGTEQGTQPEKVEDSSTDSGTQDTSTQNQTFKVGDTIKLGDYIVSITEIEDPYVETNQFSQPSSGNKYVAVDVSYENKTTDKTLDYNPYDWKLFDSEGYNYTTAIMASKDPSLSSGTLNSGGKVKGWITFEVLEASNNFKIQFTPSWLSNENVEIVLY